MSFAALACSAVPASVDVGAPPPDGGTWVRRVTPFVVVDTRGEPFAHPFLGGLNLPRPQLVDVDADGDLDLFVQEYSDRLMYFENVGTAGRAEFAWRSDRYQDVSIGEWYRFVDLDQDGRLDLLSERPFSHIRYYRNAGTQERPRLVLAADSLRDGGGRALFSDRQNIPQVTDIDCDGHLDLFVGQITGTVSHYEALDGRVGATPRFSLVTDRFQDIEIVAQIGSAHGANTMAFIDIDRDGDQDLFWGDFFEPGLLFIENRGTCEQPDLRGDPVAFPPNDPVATSGYNAPTFGDLDGDGDEDLLMGVLGGAFNPNRTTVDNLYLLEQVEGGSFETRTGRFVTAVDVGSESVPALADLDGDGDLDLYLANKIAPGEPQTSRIGVFENVGDADTPRFREREPLPFQGAYHYTPAFADLDADGDLDLLLGTWRDDVAYYRNEGTAERPQFALVDSAFVSLTRGSNASPALGDVDNDGDLDLFVGEGSGAINFYRNDGDARTPIFTLVSDAYADIDVGRRSAPTLVDLDGDGALDLVIGSETEGVHVYRQLPAAGGPTFVRIGDLALAAPPFAVPRFADLDADGRLDLVLGGIGGGVMFYAKP